MPQVCAHRPKTTTADSALFFAPVPAAHSLACQPVSVLREASFLSLSQIDHHCLIITIMHTEPSFLAWAEAA